MTASSMPKKPTAPPDIPDAVVLAALEIVLKPLGAILRQYHQETKANAIEAMRGVLMAERERAAEAATAMIAKLLSDDLSDSINGYVAAAIRKGEGA